MEAGQSPLRVVFMGTPDFAVPALAALLAEGHEVVGVYCQPPRPAGRGQKQQLSPIHAFALERGLRVRHPTRLRSPEEHEAFAALEADVAVVAAYGLILPKPILDAPRLGCLNIHASLLPRWRGAAPIHRAILAGDAATGVTIMQMDEGLDTGRMLLWESVPITATSTAASLHDQLAALGARLLPQALSGLATRSLTGLPQPAEGVTYAAKLTKDEGRIDWHVPAVMLERMTRGLNPWPGVSFEHWGERVKVLAAQVEQGSNAAPGTVLDDNLLVACGEGALRLTRVQRAGRGPMDAGAFLRGNPLPAGTMLGSSAGEA